VLFSNGTATLLGAPSESGSRVSNAGAINDQGTVLGETVGVSSKAMAFYQNLGLVDLNTVLARRFWSLQTAESINDEGQIAGTRLYNGV